MPKKIVAVDIGGSHTRISFFTGNKIIKSEKRRTIVASPEITFQNIVNFTKQFPKVDAIGVSAPGPTNYQDGIFLDLPNLPSWNGFHFLSYLKRKTAVKLVVAENDANLMAYAHHYDFQQGKNDVTQFFTISTGLGAGLIINDDIYQGASGFAQEIANAPLAFSSECGKNLGPGSIEYFASGSGLKERALIRGIKTEGSSLFEKAQINPELKLILNEAAEALANLFAVTIAMIGPNLIVLDGSVARNNQNFINDAIALVKNRVFANQQTGIRFKFGRLGDNAALVGANLFAAKKLNLLV